MTEIDSQEISERLNQLLDTLIAFASHDFTQKASISEGRDMLDSVALTLNAVGEELEATTVSKDYLYSIIESMLDALIVTTQQGTIVTINQATLDMSGYEENELVGQPINLLFDGKDIQSDSVTIHLMDATIFTKAKATIPVSLSRSLLPSSNDNPRGMVYILRNVTKQKEAEESIKAALLEKETLLKEVHHRVKNNLQVMTSLLHMQSLKSQNSDVIRLFRESEARLHSMAIIHEQLYQTGNNLAEIDFREYVKQLVRQIIRLQDANRNIILDMEQVEAISLCIEIAVPCGLIINELVCNAYKHAFPKGIGTIQIALQADGDDNVLVVSDDGIGLPDNFEVNMKTLGLRLLNTLVMQIDGILDITSLQGTTFTVRFPKEKK